MPRVSDVLPRQPLQSYACHPSQTRGRRHAEAPAPTRDDFQRDRDRVIHSTAFRRLVYKTQVFLNHEGDLFRTRLTHSLEVAQLGRSIARALGLSEDLVEAIALAHDLGHTPFGHAGQDALNECLRQEGGASPQGQDDPGGGFEHNLQSLRVVDDLEERYAAFNGLNLCFETREGILKHCSRWHAEWLEQREPRGVAARFLQGGMPSLEAQLTNLADAIAYNAHDIDDGVRSGLLTMGQLDGIALFARYRRETEQAHPGLRGRRLLFETIRRMLSGQVYDVMDTTLARLRESGVTTVDEVRQAPRLVSFSPEMQQASSDLKRFLMQNLYRHPQVMDMTARAKQVIRELYRAYASDPTLLTGAPAEGLQLGLQRRIADYIAGMTDRYAMQAHHRLTGQSVFATP